MLLQRVVNILWVTLPVSRRIWLTGCVVTEFKPLSSRLSFCRSRNTCDFSTGVINPPAFVSRTPKSNKGIVRPKMEKEVPGIGSDSSAIIWIDCEMTGLDADAHTIMEIASIITGPNLNVIAKQEPLIIHTPDRILDTMDAWCVHHHGKSGLTESCRKSKLTMEEAETILLEFVTKHTKAGACPMGGNSIYMDRKFIQKYMPKFHDHFHYRNIDVSTIKELVRRWFPQDFVNAPAKRFEHRTLADVEDSIQELEYYKTAVFRR